MFTNAIKIKRKYTERLLSHWYPGLQISYSYQYSKLKSKKVEMFSDFFINVITNIIWLFTLPTLVFLTFCNYLFIIFFKKRSWSETFAIKMPTASPKILAIGNLTLGGSGKTPTTICLVRKLLAQGIKPAVISRGYKSEIDSQNKKSQFVEIKSTTCSFKEYGDEPCLIAETGVPVCVGNRLNSLKKINLEYPNTDLILLDDGLQQTEIQCDKKILVIDDRLLGNERLFPYGPLREKPPLKYNLDGVVLNSVSDQINCEVAFKKFKLDKKTPSSHLKLSSVTWKNIKNEEFDSEFIQKKIDNNYRKFKIKPLAIAGIAFPDRFFKLLVKLGIDFEPLWLENHDINFEKNLLDYLNFSQRIVLMTEKDGVRIIYSENDSKLNIDQIWILKLNLTIEPTFVKKVTDWI